jgi:hypothetical protein
MNGDDAFPDPMSDLAFINAGPGAAACGTRSRARATQPRERGGQVAEGVDPLPEVFDL